MASSSRENSTRPINENVFIQARYRFLSSISQDEQSHFSPCSSSELLEDIKRLGMHSKAKHLGTPLLGKIKGFSDNLGPYFRVLEVFCGTHPQWANNAFGALRLILQLASNFGTFFEKLCGVLERLAARLPRYEEVFQSLATNTTTVTSRLSSSFGQLYADLFELFEAVACVFSSKDGKTRKTSIILTKLMWKPFDLRFEKILSKIDFHEEIVVQELQFEGLGRLQHTSQQEIKKTQQDTEKADDERLQMLNARDELNEISRKLFLSAVMRWIEASDFNDDLEQAQDLKTDGTTDWLFQESVFLSWRKSPTSATDLHQLNYPKSILWISGNPGWGKTVLAGATVEELTHTNHDQSECPPAVCYYFFNQNTGQRNSPVDAYRAIVAQLFQQFWMLEKVYNIFALSLGEPELRTKASEHEHVEIIRHSVLHLPNLSLVLDGVDECSNSGKLLRELASLCVGSREMI